MFDFTKVAVLIREYFGDAFIEALRREVVFLDLIGQKETAYNEKDIQWKVNYAGNSSVGSFTENASFGTAGEQAFTTALQNWKLNKAVCRVSGLAQAVSKGDGSIINAVANEVEYAIKDLKRQINLQLLSDGAGNLNGPRPELAKGGATADLTGIQAAIDDGSLVTTYANIDRTANLWWQSFVLDNGGIPRQLTEALMFQCINEIETRSGKITHGLCSPNTWTTYGLMLEQERRQVNPGQTLSGGFQTLDFSGIPLVRVPGYEEGRIDWIDIDLVDFLTLQDFAVEPRDPGSFDANEFFIKTYSQLRYRLPWHAASLRDIQV